MKAQIKAILASLVVIAVALSAVSGVTYSWWSDSENTDIDVSTGALDVKIIGDISYSSAAGTSGFFTVNKADPVKSGVTTKLELITNLSNVAPNDVYYIDYLVQYETTVLAKYLTFVGEGAPWIDVKIESHTQDVVVGNVDRANENDLVLMQWKNIPADGTVESGSRYIANEYVRVTITIADDAPMNSLSNVQIINKITQVANNGLIWDGTIPASLDDTSLDIVPGGAQNGTITVNSPGDLVYLSTLADKWVSIYSNGKGADVTQYRESNGGKGTDYYYHWGWKVILATDLDMNNIPMDSVDISYWGAFDGGNNTISNVVLNKGQDGLFNNGAKAINNLIIRNIVVDAPDAETVGALAGNATSYNVHVEKATVTGGKYVGGLVGKGSSFIDCSIMDSVVTGSQKTVGGLVGYSIGDPDPAIVSGNLVEDVTVTGAYNVGGLLGQSQNETVEFNTVRNVTVTSTQELPSNASDEEVRTGKLVARIYATVEKPVIIRDNLVHTMVYDSVELQEALNKAVEGDIIAFGADISGDATIMQSGITIDGSGKTLDGCIILNGKENVTLKDIVFDAAGAKPGYDTMKRQIANIIVGNDVNNPSIGARNLTIEGCVFTGEFVNGGAAISFTDRGRASGGSGNITIKDCTFETTKGYYDIYCYYSGYGYFIIDGCVFNSDVQGTPIYLNLYMSNTPVVLNDNVFERTTSLDESAFIKRHSATYTVSFSTDGNTFASS